jgi:hypothetical protein
MLITPHFVRSQSAHSRASYEFRRGVIFSKKVTKFAVLGPWNHTQALKFLLMTQHGYGVSREYARNNLSYSIESGGNNILLPSTLEAVEKNVMRKIIAMQGHRKTYELDIPIPDDVRQLVRPKPPDLYVYICPHVYVSMCIYVYICLCEHVYMCMCVCVCVQ